jgi:hypothetical protein
MNALWLADERSCSYITKAQIGEVVGWPSPVRFVCRPSDSWRDALHFQDRKKSAVVSTFLRNLTLLDHNHGSVRRRNGGQIECERSIISVNFLIPLHTLPISSPPA